MSRQLTSGVIGRRKKDIFQPEFIILVDTALAGSSSDTMQLPIRGTNMTIDWGDGFVQTGVTQTLTPASANWITRVYPDGGGVKQIKVTGLDWIRFANTGDRLKLLEIRNWGTGQWATMQNSFQGCANMIGTFTDVPDLSNVTAMNSMFRQATAFNSDISQWNTANVTNMSAMFLIATAFNSDISNWDTINVTNMNAMFQRATNFNSDISLWNTAKVTNMGAMFQQATNFNSDISGWNTANVTNMTQMFYIATAFNQDLSGWCVTLIPSLPLLFDISATAWTLPNSRPIWGTCPA